MSDKFTPVVQEVELLVAEAREMASEGLHFRILHRFHEAGSVCRPGEEVALVSFMHRSREISLGLAVHLRLTFDYLARHRHTPLSAAEIAMGMKCDDFCSKHGAYAARGTPVRLVSPRSVKEYVKRIRRSLGWAFREAGLKVDPFEVLRSESTASNRVNYRLKCTAEWRHEG